MVDTSEWLFETNFIRDLGFCVDYSLGDWLTCHSEDSKLLDAVVARGDKIPSTKQPTLRYYMGGYSNGSEQDGVGPEAWQ